MPQRNAFDKELELLNEELVKMCSVVERAIDLAITAFQNQDEALAEEIIRGDRVVNDMEKSVETRCLSLILRQQPVARDLRIVSTALKMVTDLERIGDHAADIAELIVRIGPNDLFSIARHIPQMADTAKGMVHDAVSAFCDMDVPAAVAIEKRDDEVDELFDQVKNEVAELLRSGAEDADLCIDLLMIAKYFERIGDHAVNLCEWIEFCETGLYKNTQIL